jgi:hypothetical protein
MGRYIQSIILLAFLALLPVSVNADDTLPAATAITAIADGAPWRALTENGRRATITLNSDGTGTFEGPITMSITWAIERDVVCLNLRIAGKKCLTFRKVPDGYVGLADGKVDLTLTR